MGFRNMVNFNRALLAKQGWQSLNRPSSIVTKLLKAKYYPTGDFMKAELGSDPSYTWRSLLKGRELGTRFRIGDGSKISIWNDPWLPKPHTFKPFSLPMEGTENWCVGDIIDSENKEWNSLLMEDLFTKEEAETIMSIPLSLRQLEDKYVWHFDKRGIYSVRSGYHLAQFHGTFRLRASTSSGEHSASEGVWRRLWRANVPPKVKSSVGG